MLQIITEDDKIEALFERCFERAGKKFLQKDSKPQPIIVSGDEICNRFDITIQTLIRWRKKGKVPFMQIGASIRYDLNNVITALEVGNKKKGVSN